MPVTYDTGITLAMDLSICIVNWNARDFLVGCLGSLNVNPLPQQYEIIVVDNASDDGSIRAVSERFPGVRVLALTENIGFAGANNIALRASTGRYLLLLNPDTVVSGKALSGMVDFMDSHPSAGACGCRLVHPSSGEVEVSARSFPTISSLLWNLTYVARLFPRSELFSNYLRTYQSTAEPYAVDWVTGACLMVRRTALEQVGELDNGYFMYWEDADWCYRFKQGGWQVYFVPNIEIKHYRGESSRLRQGRLSEPQSIWSAQQYVRSILRFYRKYYGRLQSFLLRSIIIVTAIEKALLWSTFGSVRYGWKSGSWRAICNLAMIPVALKPIRHSPPRRRFV